MSLAAEVALAGSARKTYESMFEARNIVRQAAVSAIRFKNRSDGFICVVIMQNIEKNTLFQLLVYCNIMLVWSIPLGTAALAAPLKSAQSKQVRTESEICKHTLDVPGVQARFNKEHRLRIDEEVFHQEKRSHIYLCFSDQTLPYIVSLGWFISKDESDTPAFKAGKFLHKRGRSDGPVAIDEMGLILPPPGASPASKNFDKGDWHAVLGFDRLIENNFSAAEKEFDQALKVAPANARFNNNQAAVLALQGKYGAASTLIDKAIKENENFGVAWVNRAFLSLAIGQPALALDDAGKALKLSPNLVPAKIAYTRALIENGRAQEALKLAEELRAAASAYDEWQSILLLNDALIASGDYKRARSHLEQLLVLSPGNADIILKVAHCNEKLGDLDEAIKRARQAVQAAPNDARVHIVLAKYLEENRDEKAALLQYSRALELKPERALRKTAMGAILRLLIADKKVDQADDLSKKWLKQFSDDAECHYNRAWIASQLQGNYTDETINEYKKAIDMQPKLASARYNLALTLIKSGQTSEALEQLHAFVKSAPDDSDSQAARDLIRKLESKG